MRVLARRVKPCLAHSLCARYLTFDDAKGNRLGLGGVVDGRGRYRKVTKGQVHAQNVGAIQMTKHGVGRRELSARRVATLGARPRKRHLADIKVRRCFERNRGIATHGITAFKHLFDNGIRLGIPQGKVGNVARYLLHALDRHGRGQQGLAWWRETRRQGCQARLDAVRIQWSTVTVGLKTAKVEAATVTIAATRPVFRSALILPIFFTEVALVLSLVWP